MTTSAFLLALLRTVLVAAPVLAGAHAVRRRFSASHGAFAVVVEAVVALSWLLVVGELLGLVGALRFGWLVASLWASALVAVVALRTQPNGEAEADKPSGDRGPPRDPVGVWIAVGVVWLVVGQWVFVTADMLGSGMTSFDVLWYHMPFAAVFARTGSVTGITFTQADPFVAYYPANSELFHAFGIIAFGNDFLSLFVNLGWMALALLGSWCVGRRWRVEWWTLAAGAVLLSLPVLSTTQPGGAFNDVVGLAAVTLALALILAPERGALELLAAGLAFGIAVGTKYTFLVPVAALVIGVVATSARGERRRVGGLLAGGLLLTGSWWYVRATVRTGNPLGLRQTLGPVHLGGARSPLASATQQTVFSEIRHISLWGSRFAPGLAHAFGPLWPVLLIGCLAAAVAALATRSEPLIVAIAVATALAAITYLLFPTGATAIQHNTTLFQVNLRYLAPALALGLLLAPIAVALHARRLLPWLGVAFAAIAVSSQFEPNVWPSQPSRHAVFLIGTAVLLVLAIRAWPQLMRARPRTLAVGGIVLAMAAIAVGEVAQRHYFDRRYLVGRTGEAGVEPIYRWAQTVARAHIALYGTVEQYPLYGAMDTNIVSYLGQPAPDGGYQPITSCSRWQTTLASGHYDYLVLTPAPTTAIPLAWSQQDPDLRVILHPSANDWVFKISREQPHNAPRRIDRTSEPPCHAS